MSTVNDTMDRAMRGLVRRRMGPTIAYDATDTALVLVAPQQGVLDGQIAKLARLLRAARAAGITVIYAPSAPATDRRRPLPPAQQAILDAAVLDPCSPGAMIPARLAASPDDVVLDPFTALSAFTDPALASALAERRLHRVILAGARTDVEVDSTARDATEAGLHATVVSDCCIGSTPARHAAAVDVTLPRLVHAVLTLGELPQFGLPLDPHGTAIPGATDDW